MKISTTKVICIAACISLAASAAFSEERFLPDPTLTPGEVLPVSKDDICVSGYTKKVRNVPMAVKQDRYAAYGIRRHAPGEYEMDHLIPLEVGGSNSAKNLWPEPDSGLWNYHVKDALENKLHKLVCSGKLDLKTAQAEIANDWISAYKKYFHSELPITKAAKLSSRDVGSHTGEVWVNTRSGVYWLPGTAYYGNTKEGEYMSEEEALAHGYHAPGRKSK